jgi:UDP-N-acetylglucosamine 2-epimerase
VVRVLGYRSGGPGSIPGTTRKIKVVGLEGGSLSLVSTTEELLDRKVANRSFGNVSQSKYLGTTVTNQNLIQEEIKGRLNSGNACYHSVQNLLSSRLLSKNVKIRIYKTMLPVVLDGCETWSDIKGGT